MSWALLVFAVALPSLGSGCIEYEGACEPSPTVVEVVLRESVALPYDVSLEWEDRTGSFRCESDLERGPRATSQEGVVIGGCGERGFQVLGSQLTFHFELDGAGPTKELTCWPRYPGGEMSWSCPGTTVTVQEGAECLHREVL